MIVMKDNERHYATSWQYNSARILTRLAQLVTAQGGKVKPLHPAILSDRNLEDDIQDIEARIRTLTEQENESHSDAQTLALQTCLSRLDHLRAISNTPITVTHTSYISFIMNGLYYSYQLDSNPFFPFYYMKTPIENGTYSGDACLANEPKPWLNDNSFIRYGCSDSEIETAAQAILALLLAAPLSTLRHDTKRTRVPNIYDSGSHFENIPVKERRFKIDF